MRDAGDTAPRRVMVGRAAPPSLSRGTAPIALCHFVPQSALQRRIQFVACANNFSLDLNNISARFSRVKHKLLAAVRITGKPERREHR